MIQVRLTNRVRLKTRLYGIQQFSIANSHELTFPGRISWRAVANAVVGVDGVKITSAKHRESLRRGQRSKRRVWRWLGSSYGGASAYRDKSWPKMSREKKAAGGVFKTVKHIFLLVF